jgi:hypothetical protein
MQMNRRQILGAAGSFAFLRSTHSLSQEKAPSEKYSDPSAADEWVQAWMQSTRDVAGAFRIGRFADGMYFTTHVMGWRPSKEQMTLRNIIVPIGFVTDFASIPRVFWSILPKDGPYAFAAVIHDHLYWEQSESREAADLTFRYAMEDFKVDSVSVNLIYAAVRLGGGSAWEENAALKKKGERRVLVRFPTSPLIEWKAWKNEQQNFK